MPAINFLFTNLFSFIKMRMKWFAQNQIVMFIIVSLLLIFLLSACITVEPTELPAPTPSLIVSIVEKELPTSEASEEKSILEKPTPAPTATPGVIAEVIDDIAKSTGADRIHLLGLSLEDWLNFIVSLFIILISVLLISRLLYFFLERIVSRTPSKYDNLFLEKIRSLIIAFLVVFSLEIATLRLGFLSPSVKQLLKQVYWALYVLIFSVAAWRLVDIVIEWFQIEVEPQHEDHQVDTILPLIQRTARFVIVIVGFLMILSINNINVDVLIAALGISGLAISLAAQDSLANMISGVILLLDKPFRVGDRVEIEELGTWGDVVDIGLRTTRIRTRDNRLVIVPNSKIGSDQIINYTYPDPRYRIEMEIGLDYREDIDEIRQIIIGAVREVEGIILDKPVEALYVEMGDSEMVFRVRWWIESYIDTRRIYDRVNTAVQRALQKAGIDLPSISYDINIRNAPEKDDLK